MKTMLRLMALMCLGLTTAWAQSSVPSEMNYQGLLLDANGSPLATRNYSITFTIFDQLATGTGTAVWGPVILNVPVVDGQFNVKLGPTDTSTRPLGDAFNAGTRYLELKVDNNNPVSPRQQILSAPFAFRAAKADKLGDYNWSDVFDNGNPATGRIPGAKLADGGVSTGLLAVNAVTTDKILNGAVTPEKLAGGAVTEAWLAPGAVTATKIGPGAIQSSHIGILNRLTASDGDPANAVFVDAQGWTGIGTTSPAGGLHVATGPAWSSANYGANLVVDGTRHNAIALLDSASANPWAIFNGTGALSFSQMPPLGDTSAQPTNRFSLSRDGSVVGGAFQAVSLVASGSITAGYSSVTLNEHAIDIKGQGAAMIVGGPSIPRLFPKLTLTQPPDLVSPRPPTKTATIEFLPLSGVSGVVHIGTYGLSVDDVPTATTTLATVVYDTNLRQFLRASSSLRYKENVRPLEDDPYRVLTLEAKQFTWKARPGRWDVGYIAEEVDAAGLKTLTVYDEQGRPDGVDYARIVVYSNEVLKDQEARLRAQQAEIDTLRSEVAELKQALKQVLRKGTPE